MGSNKFLTTEQFIERANKKHNNIFDYSEVNYVSSRNNVKIKCHKHGLFDQKANNHLNGAGCPICGREQSSLIRSSSTQEFIYKANKIHNNKYDYSLVDYKQAFTKIKIICTEHRI